MRKIIDKLVNTVAELRHDGVWVGPNKDYIKRLNDLTEIKLEDTTPAQGDPVAVVFYQIVKLLGDVEVIDTTKPTETTPEDVVM